LYSLFFGCPADLADHDDRLGVRVFLEESQYVQVVGAVDRVSADTDAGGLTESRHELPDRFVGQVPERDTTPTLPGLWI
jgi:hypothetical protein